MKPLLVDTGPLVALLNRGDPDHSACVAVLEQEPGALVTTWAVVTKAMDLLADALPAQVSILAMIESSRLAIVDGLGDVARIGELMRKYRDLPMDFADATLVALAEREGLARVFTLDSDFRVYQLRRRGAFEILP